MVKKLKDDQNQSMGDLNPVNCLVVNKNKINWTILYPKLKKALQKGMIMKNFIQISNIKEI